MNFRPDIAIKDNSSVTTLEITNCHEANLKAYRQYKIDKYSMLLQSGPVLIAGKNANNCTIEVSTMGLIYSMEDFI